MGSEARYGRRRSVDDPDASDRALVREGRKLLREGFGVATAASPPTRPPASTPRSIGEGRRGSGPAPRNGEPLRPTGRRPSLHKPVVRLSSISEDEASGPNDDRLQTGFADFDSYFSSSATTRMLDVSGKARPHSYRGHSSGGSTRRRRSVGLAAIGEENSGNAPLAGAPVDQYDSLDAFCAADPIVSPVLPRPSMRPARTPVGVATDSRASTPLSTDALHAVVADEAFSDSGGWTQSQSTRAAAYPGDSLGAALSARREQDQSRPTSRVSRPGSSRLGTAGMRMFSQRGGTQSRRGLASGTASAASSVTGDSGYQALLGVGGDVRA